MGFLGACSADEAKLYVDQTANSKLASFVPLLWEHSPCLCLVITEHVPQR